MQAKCLIVAKNSIEVALLDLRSFGILHTSRIIVSRRRFEIKYRFHFKGQEDFLTLEIGLIGCPEALVRRYNFKMREVQVERRSH